MKIEKGTIIKRTRTNSNPHCESANTASTFMVERVNKTTYSIKCIGGYMAGTCCKMTKGFAAESTDIYGTVTKYEIIN